MTAKVLAVIEPVVEGMGADRDPHCWVAWAEDPGVRYTIFVPVAPGLAVCSVRVNVPGEGPRASAKLVRWSRVQVGELVFETQGGHRVASFQLEQQVIRAADAGADRISRFALAVLAAIDGRPIPELGQGRGPRPAARKGATARTAVAKTPAAAAATRARTGAIRTAGPRPASTRALGPGTAPDPATGSPKPA